MITYDLQTFKYCHHLRVSCVYCSGLRFFKKVTYVSWQVVWIFKEHEIGKMSYDCVTYRYNVLYNIPFLSKSFGLIFISILFIEATIPMKECQVIPMYLLLECVLFPTSDSNPHPNKFPAEQCQVALTHSSLFSLH